MAIVKMANLVKDLPNKDLSIDCKMAPTLMKKLVELLQIHTCVHRRHLCLITIEH